MQLPSLGLSRWPLAAAVSCVLAGCYAVTAAPGSPCVDSTHCPVDQQCVAGVCSATQKAPAIDAGLHDAAQVVDAGVHDAAPGDAGPAATCQSSDACTTAMTLGTISGDVGNQTLTATGSRSAWFRVRVTEDAPFSDGSMQVLARLTLPAGEDFDLRVYVHADADVLECTRTTGTATTSGAAKEVRASWQDVFDDGSRTVSLEVVPRSGSCAPTAKWQLTIEGNAS